MAADPLLEPFRLRHLVLKNRIMSTSHNTNSLRLATVRRPGPWVVGHSPLRSVLSVTSRHELIQLCDLVAGGAAKNVGAGDGGSGLFQAERTL